MRTNVASQVRGDPFGTKRQLSQPRAVRGRNRWSSRCFLEGEESNILDFGPVREKKASDAGVQGGALYWHALY